jgi:hypothetical protein
MDTIDALIPGREDTFYRRQQQPALEYPVGINRRTEAYIPESGAPHPCPLARLCRRRAQPFPRGEGAKKAYTQARLSTAVS